MPRYTQRSQQKQNQKWKWRGVGVCVCGGLCVLLHGVRFSWFGTLDLDLLVFVIDRCFYQMVGERRPCKLCRMGKWKLNACFVTLKKTHTHIDRQTHTGERKDWTNKTTSSHTTRQHFCALLGLRFHSNVFAWTESKRAQYNARFQQQQIASVFSIRILFGLFSVRVWTQTVIHFLCWVVLKE